MDEEAAEFVSVEPEGAGFDVNFGSWDVRGGVAFVDPFDLARRGSGTRECGGGHTGVVRAAHR